MYFSLLSGVHYHCEGIFCGLTIQVSQLLGSEIAAPGTSLVVQWLRLYVLNAGIHGLNPGQGTRSHMPQLRSSAAK